MLKGGTMPLSANDNDQSGCLKTPGQVSCRPEAIINEPDKGYYLYRLAVSHYELGRMEEARETFAQAWPQLKNSLPPFFRDYALCLCQLGYLSPALQVVQMGLACYPDYPDLYYLQGLIYRECGFLLWAKCSFEQCTRFAFCPADYQTMAGVNTYEAWENLAEISGLMGEEEATLQYILKALAFAKDESHLYRYGRLLHKRGYSGERLLEYLHNETSLSCGEIAALLLAAGYFSEGLQVMDTNGIQLSEPVLTSGLQQVLASWDGWEDYMQQFPVPLSVKEPEEEEQRVYTAYLRLLQAGNYRDAFLGFSRLASERPEHLAAARAMESLAANLRCFLLRHLSEEDYDVPIVRYLVDLATVEKTWRSYAQGKCREKGILIT